MSGARPVAERGLEQLIKRAESGASAGVVVYKIDRFGRNLAEVVVAVARLKDASARLVAIQDAYDSDAPMGSIMLGIFGALAELYYEGQRAGWSDATSRAVASGIHIANRAPYGYRRRDEVEPDYDEGKLVRNGRLVTDDEAAKHVHKVFELRARGSTYGEVGAHLAEATGRQWSKSGIVGLLMNRAYLGEARGAADGPPNPNAHDPIIEPDLFAAAQPRPLAPRTRDGKLSRDALLVGLVTCAACGHKLQIVGSTDRKGNREPSYTCARRYAGGDCPAPASARVRLVDEYVLWRMQEDEETLTAGVASAEQAFLTAREAVREAEASRAAWVTNLEVERALGFEAHAAGTLARQAALDEAQRALWDAGNPGVDEDAPVVYVDGMPVVYEVWDELTMSQRRAHMAKFIESVTLAKADPARRRWQPVGERVTLKWRGQ